MPVSCWICAGAAATAVQGCRLGPSLRACWPSSTSAQPSNPPSPPPAETHGAAHTHNAAAGWQRRTGRHASQPAAGRAAAGSGRGGRSVGGGGAAANEHRRRGGGGSRRSRRVALRPAVAHRCGRLRSPPLAGQLSVSRISGELADGRVPGDGPLLLEILRVLSARWWRLRLLLLVVVYRDGVVYVCMCARTGAADSQAPLSNTNSSHAVRANEQVAVGLAESGLL